MSYHKADKYKKGDVVFVKNRFGQIQAHRFFISAGGDSFYVYLHFDMSTEHKAIEDDQDIVEPEDLPIEIKEAICDRK